MKIEKEIVLDLARQIYLNISDEDVETLCDDIGQTVENVKILDEVDVSDIKPDVCVIEKHNVFRKDNVIENDNTEFLQNAKETHNNMFKIPKIL